jgi:N-carbamoyl-L-amino-acid hydrolase
MRALGYDPDAAIAQSEGSLHAEAIHAFIEPHIEQGPVLEGRGVPIGLVTCISGSWRYRQARCVGAYGHSGAVPRGFRQDAVLAVADLIVELDRLWLASLAAGESTTITVGEIGTDPTQHGFSKIAGEVRFCLDVRGLSMPSLDRLHAAFLPIVQTVEKRHNVAYALGPRTGSTPVELDAELRRSFAAAAERAGIPTIEMASGAGHDTAVFAGAGVPSLAIFVRNQNGSHNPDEAMRMEDFRAVVALLVARLG